MPIDEIRFRQTMSHFASGVTVVTVEQNGAVHGMTVSSFSSVSLRPPLILICIDTVLSTHTVIAESGRFAVNILEKRQEHLSRRFASREGDKFQGVAWHFGQLGLPLLDGALASIECRVHSQLPGGDHSIFVGEVLHTELGEGAPLLYYRSGYHELK